MNNIRTEMEIGLPPITKIQRGYAVFVSTKYKGFSREWTPVQNSWGYPYVQLGHAINKAKSEMRWRQGRNSHICVVDISTMETKWASWEQTQDSNFYVKKGDRVQ
tara:strand:+ start:1835 stop:2149 length:315 start_codon:yes stop_codon:yes gene_type:complete